MTTINKEMIIAEIINIEPKLIAVLMASGMHCVGCPSAQGESLEQAAIVHGIDPDELTKSLNDFLAENAE